MMRKVHPMEGRGDFAATTMDVPVSPRDRVLNVSYDDELRSRGSVLAWSRRRNCVLGYGPSDAPHVYGAYDDDDEATLRLLRDGGLLVKVRVDSRDSSLVRSLVRKLVLVDDALVCACLGKDVVDSAPATPLKEIDFVAIGPCTSRLRDAMNTQYAHVLEERTFSLFGSNDQIIDLEVVVVSETTSSSQEEEDAQYYYQKSSSSASAAKAAKQVVSTRRTLSLDLYFLGHARGEGHS